MGLRFISPISTNTIATDFGVSGKYATMVNNKSRECRYHYFMRHVTECVDCPFHYTEG